MAELSNETIPIEMRGPQVYCNGFALNLSNADVSLNLIWNGVHTSTVSMSFTTAKTLRNLLNELITKLETESGHEIMDISYMETVLRKFSTSTSDDR